MAVELALGKSDAGGSQPMHVRCKDVLSSLGLMFVPENSRERKPSGWDSSILAVGLGK